VLVESRQASAHRELVKLPEASCRELADRDAAHLTVRAGKDEGAPAVMPREEGLVGRRTAHRLLGSDGLRVCLRLLDVRVFDLRALDTEVVSALQEARFALTLDALGALRNGLLSMTSHFIRPSPLLDCVCSR
jgi:hypothetical protein